MKKTGRNDPCPCGSGKRYKQCCGSLKDVQAAKTGAVQTSAPEALPAALERDRAGGLSQAEAIYSSLRDRARAGDVDALTELGKKLLIGDGVRQAMPEAVAMITEAAARGGGEATAQLALFAAWGVLRPRDFDEALDHLQRAAELGWAPSQRELRFLARDTGADWPALRRRVSVADWTEPPPARVVCEAPRIVTIQNFASPAICDWLIERGGRNLRRATVYQGSAELRTNDTRTNTEADFTIRAADLVLNLLRERMAAVIGAPTAMFEITKILHYEPGQHFSLHADFLDTRTPSLAREVEKRGQRVATFLVYLNDDFEGGETDFPRVGYRYKGARGDALLFHNVDASGAPDYKTLHAGLPPTRGVKWLLSQWIRNRPVTG